MLDLTQVIKLSVAGMALLQAIDVIILGSITSHCKCTALEGTDYKFLVQIVPGFKHPTDHFPMRLAAHFSCCCEHEREDMKAIWSPLFTGIAPDEKWNRHFEELQNSSD